jgi:hypothetical protein
MESQMRGSSSADRRRPRSVSQLQPIDIARTLWDRAKCWALGMALFSALAGCTRPIQAVRADPTLTGRDLTEGKVALLPIAARPSELTLEQLTVLDEALAIAVRENAHGLTPVPQATVIRALATDATNHAAVIDFAQTGTIDAPAVVRLRKATGARFLLFTKVDYHEMRNPFTPHATGADSGRPRLWANAVDKETLIGPEPISEIIAVSTLVDASTRKVRWEARHRVVRSVGESTDAPRPARVSWTLFSELSAHLPGPQ